MDCVEEVAPARVFLFEDWVVPERIVFAGDGTCHFREVLRWLGCEVLVC